MAIFSSTKRRFSKRLSSRTTPARFLVGALFVLLLVVLGTLRIFLPTSLDTVLIPLWSAGNAAASFTKGISAIFVNRANLVAERDTLRAQNAALSAEYEALRAREAGLEASFGRTPKGEGVLATVVLRPPVSPYDVLVIDEGGHAGVEAGDLVVAPGSIPLGRISSVGEKSARVLLFSAPGTEEAVWVGTKHIPGTLLGEGSGAFSVSLPRAAEVEEGDLVALPAFSGGVVGTVAIIEEDPSSPVKKIYVKNSTNLFSLFWVRVLPSSI